MARPYVIAAAAVLVAAAIAAPAHGDPRAREAQRVVNAITRAFGGPGPTAACFWRIAERESHLSPHEENLADRHADGSRGSFGALQIGALWRRPGETVDHFARRMFNPAENARAAHWLYLRFGLQPWGGYC